jgi:hypothetical protein
MDFRSFGPYNIFLSYARQLIILNNRTTAFSVYAHANTSKFGKLVVNWSGENINSDVTKLNFVFSSSMVECGFETRSSKTKDYKISIRCFFAKNASASSKDWLARNQDNACGRVGATYIYPRTVVSVS